jgi:hypothetical protein
MTLPCPSLKMSMKGLRSSSSTIAPRSSGLSNGGAVWLTISVRLPVATVVSQIACGAWFLRSFKSGIETPYGKVMSTFPAVNASIRVDRLGMIVYSMPSR